MWGAGHAVGGPPPPLLLCSCVQAQRFTDGSRLCCWAQSAASNPAPPCQTTALHPQAHTNVDVIVDIAAFRALLADRLPLVFAGWPVEAAALPWPEQEGAAEAEAEDLIDDEL